MTTDALIRPATREDRHARWQITHDTWQAAYGHIYQADEIEAVFDDLIYQQQSWGRHRGQLLGHLVAERDGALVGFVGMALLLPREDKRLFGEITALYVLPREQGRGTGRRLWEAGLDVLRAHDCEAAWVWTLARALAVDFYRYMGAKQAARGIYTIGGHDEPAIGFLIRL
jgi:GNAT superfamily N-acetyltransferase